MSKGGHLASVHSAEEDERISQVMREHTTSAYPWLGGYSTPANTPGTYKWSDGTAWDYMRPQWNRNDRHPNYLHYYRYNTWGTWCPTCRSEGICKIPSEMYLRNEPTGNPAIEDTIDDARAVMERLNSELNALFRGRRRQDGDLTQYHKDFPATDRRRLEQPSQDGQTGEIDEEPLESEHGYWEDLVAEPFENEDYASSDSDASEHGHWEEIVEESLGNEDAAPTDEHLPVVEESFVNEAAAPTDEDASIQKNTHESSTLKRLRDSTDTDTEGRRLQESYDSTELEEVEDLAELDFDDLTELVAPGGEKSDSTEADVGDYVGPDAETSLA